MKNIIFGIIALLFLNPIQAEELWLTDITAAKTKAEKESKDILIVFIAPENEFSLESLNLNEKILSKPEFKTEIVKKYVPVMVIVTKDKKDMPIEQVDIIETHIYKFGVYSLPTIVFMDHKSRALGIVRTVPLSVEDLFVFSKQVEIGKEFRDKNFDKAKIAPEGPEKTKSIHNGLTFIQRLGKVFDTWCLFGYDEEIKQIIALDPENKTGVVPQWDYRVLANDLEPLARTGKLEDCLKAIGKVLTKYPNDKQMTQALLFLKAQIHGHQKNPEECIKTLKDLIAVAPETEMAKDATKVLEEVEREIKK